MTPQWALGSYFVQDRPDSRGVASEIISNVHIETFAYLQSINMELNIEAGGGCQKSRKVAAYLVFLTFLPLFDCLADLDSVCNQDSQ